MYKAIVYTLAGLDAPELMKGSLKIAQGFSQDPHSFLMQLKKGKLYGRKENSSTNNRKRRPRNK